MCPAKSKLCRHSATSSPDPGNACDDPAAPETGSEMGGKAERKEPADLAKSRDDTVLRQISPKHGAVRSQHIAGPWEDRVMRGPGGEAHELHSEPISGLNLLIFSQIVLPNLAGPMSSTGLRT